MRPEILFPYFSPIASLKGVGPKSVPKIEAHIGKYVRDLLFFLPNSIVHRPLGALSETMVGSILTLEVEVTGHRNASINGPGRIDCVSNNLALTLVYFHYYKGMAERHPVGVKRYVSGQIEKFGNYLQITHPDYLVSLEHRSDIPEFEPHYRGCEGLGSKTIAKLIRQGFSHILKLDEWLDSTHMNSELWQSFNNSLLDIHYPKKLDILLPEGYERSRLAYDEALAHQLALKARRMHRANTRSISINDKTLSDRFITALPFGLTRAQKKALEDIRGDLRSGQRMNRLIQGDVGSGKTIIAFIIALDVISQGGQVVFMAPTEILARQHFETGCNHFQHLNIVFDILTGADKGLKRKQKLDIILSGMAQIIFGTHALFQDKVAFKNLQLAVIDEQHRFGVEQRQRLFSKGNEVHLLSMSATPIPRTLALTAYGEADLTTLDEKPQGRQPIQTAVLPRERMTDVTNRLKVALDKGSQAYWVCPLVEETEDSDLIAIEHRYGYLTSLFNNKVGLIHGRMSAVDKNAIIERFLSREIAILCATTVIEVGVNVPNATIMIIEQAERFGLAQLHQLRGRVGRGNQLSSCLLLYDSPLSKKAKQRLELLRDTEDGFLISEMDWKMRGEGDLLGAKQSGAPNYVFIDMNAHQNLIERAAKEAEYCLSQWPKLSSQRQNALNQLQNLFDWRADQVGKLD
jgi:ATP-dependent DNA helicase RecG